MRSDTSFHNTLLHMPQEPSQKLNNIERSLYTRIFVVLHSRPHKLEGYTRGKQAQATPVHAMPILHVFIESVKARVVSRQDC